jgi:hypothetical protein
MTARFSNSGDGDFLDNGCIIDDVVGLLNFQDELIQALWNQVGIMSKEYHKLEVELNACKNNE